MVFELVKLNLAHFQSKRGSEDSAVLGKHSSIEACQDHGSTFLCAETPVPLCYWVPVNNHHQ